MKKQLREKLGQWLGRKPPQMQVAALCRDAVGHVLLVTSRDTGRWIIPKGWPMPGRSLADAAGQEAWEEAGARGAVTQAQIGSYHYDKRQDRGFAIPVEVRVYGMAVSELAERYPEAHQRRRGWFTPERAAQLVAETGLQALLRGLPAPVPGGPEPLALGPAGREAKRPGKAGAGRGAKARAKRQAAGQSVGQSEGRAG